jgi:hypothetical protein
VFWNEEEQLTKEFVATRLLLFPHFLQSMLFSNNQMSLF